jgi:hypothetical protein
MPQPTTPNTYYQTPTVETQQSISTPQEKKYLNQILLSD